jgi:hypothetical protein
MKKQHWQDWVNLFLGIWVLVSPWAIGRDAGSALASNACIVGVAVTAVALGALIAFRLWEEWVTLVLGLWLLVSPWFLGFTVVSALAWNTVVIGIIVTVCAAWALTNAQDVGKPVAK